MWFFDRLRRLFSKDPEPEETIQTVDPVFEPGNGSALETAILERTKVSRDLKKATEQYRDDMEAACEDTAKFQSASSVIYPDEDEDSTED